MKMSEIIPTAKEANEKSRDRFFEILAEEYEFSVKLIADEIASAIGKSENQCNISLRPSDFVLSDRECLKKMLIEELEALGYRVESCGKVSFNLYW